MRSIRRIAMMSGSEQDLTLLRSLMSVLGSHAGQSWEYSSEASADVVFIDNDHPPLGEVVAHGTQSVLVSFGGLRREGLQYHLPRPLRLRPFMDMLAQIAADDFRKGAHSEPIVIKRPLPFANHLVQMVMQRSKGRFLVQKIWEGQAHEILVDFDAGLVRYPSALALTQFVQAGVPFEMTPGSINTVLTREAPLAELLWVACIHSQNPQLLPALNGATRFRILHAPTAKIATANPKLMRLAACLSQQWAGIEQVVMELGVERSLVIGFINACLLTRNLKAAREETAAAR